MKDLNATPVTKQGTRSHSQPILPWLCLIALMSVLAPLPGQPAQLELQEISRFAFTSHDSHYARESVVRYPFIYMPNSYGFQVCLWDSLAGTFTEIANYGVQGSVNELVAWQNYLFLDVSYFAFSDVQPDMGALYKVDISDPWHPQPAGCVTVGANIDTYGNLHILNDTLLAYKESDGYLQGLVLFDPVCLHEIGFYPQNYHFEVIGNQYVVSRPFSSDPFQLFAVDADTGLQLLGTFTLPHYAVNSFPWIFDAGPNIAGLQCGEGIRLFDFSDPLNWTLISEILRPFSARGVSCNGFLLGANYDPEEETSSFFIYDVSDPTNPVFADSTAYPEGLGYGPDVERMSVCGSFLFHHHGNEGCVCLRLDGSGNLSFIGKCYRFSTALGRGRKYGSYVLQPFYRSGVACFDVSVPQDPSYAYSILEGNSARIDVCGELLLALLNPNSHATSTDAIFDIGDLQNPQLVSSFPSSPEATTFFHYAEPGCFYRLDNSYPAVLKYCVQNGQANLVFSYPVPLAMHSPTFINGQLYLLSNAGSGVNDLYVCAGLPENEPQPPVYYPHYFSEEYVYMYNAGDFGFVRTFSPPLPSLFVNADTTLMVPLGLFGFGFRNFVCVGRFCGVSFYDAAAAAGLHDWVAEALYLPQCSYSLYIDWDEDYLYLFGNDNIAIYSYEITSGNADIQAPELADFNCGPNPFSADTRLNFGLKDAGRCSLSVFNLRGQRVRNLQDGALAAGKHSVAWDGRDDTGRPVAAGVYLCKLQHPGGTQTLRLLRLK